MTLIGIECIHYKGIALQRCCLTCNPPTVVEEETPHTCFSGAINVLDFTCEGCTEALHTGGFDGLLHERLEWARQTPELLNMKSDRDRLDDILNAVREALGVPENYDITKYAAELRRMSDAMNVAPGKDELTKKVEDIDKRLKKLEMVARRYV